MQNDKIAELFSPLLASCDLLAAEAGDDPIQREGAAALRQFVELSTRHAELQAELQAVRAELATLEERFRQLARARTVAPAGKQ